MKIQDHPSYVDCRDLFKEQYTPTEVLDMWDKCLDIVQNVSEFVFNDDFMKFGYNYISIREEMLLNFLVFMGVDV